MIPEYSVSGIYRTIRLRLLWTRGISEKMRPPISLLRIFPIETERDASYYQEGTKIDVVWRRVSGTGYLSPLQSSFCAMCEILSGPPLYAPMFLEMILPKTFIRLHIVKMEDQKSGTTGVMTLPDVVLRGV